MIEEKKGKEIRLKEIDQKGNYFIKEIKQNELLSKQHKKICKILNYPDHLLIVSPAVTGCVSISAFASLFGIPVGITSSAAAIKISVTTAEIKNYKSIITKRKRNVIHDTLLVKTKLNTIKVLNSKTLTDSHIGHDELALVNNVLKEYILAMMNLFQ